MGGFLLGSLALIALEVVLQPDVSKNLANGSNVVTSALNRLLSPSVPLIPRAGAGKTTAAPAYTNTGPGTGPTRSATVQHLPITTS
jgi:hypothetical protein